MLHIHLSGNMTASFEDLIKLYPARRSQVDLLYNLFAYEDEPIPESVFVHGCSSVGKSTLVGATLEVCHIRCAAVNLIECYTPKILFETVLNKLSGHVIDPVRGQPYAKCDTMMDFVFNLERCARERNDLHRAAIILDKAERLRDMDANLLAGFLRLRELCSGGGPSTSSLCVIFISELPFPKYYYRGNVVEPITIHFPQYSMKELIEILSLDYDNAMEIINNNHPESIDVDIDFYKNYLNVFLSVFYRTCRDLNELRYVSRMNFLSYCEPIISGKCNATNAVVLWKNISPILKSSLGNLYLRISSRSDESGITKKDLAHSIELPFYAKYLLIAAYLASYNSARDDKRLFMKDHGKKRKTMKDVKAKSKVSEQLSTQLGPKAFNFDRLIAIFYAILDDKVNFNNNLLAQVSSLVELQFLTAYSDGCNLDGQKYKCTVGYDFIQSVSKDIGFNVRKYLSDFSHM